MKLWISLRSLAGLLVVLVGASAAMAQAPASPPLKHSPRVPFEVRDGDRVVLLGATFIERLAAHDYFETALTSAWPERRFTVRNLGWSGDIVNGRARSRFGGESGGFDHLQQHVAGLKPTVIVVGYGNNEAYEGEAGLPRFKEGLKRLLDTLEKTGAAIAILSPLRRENLGKPLPDPAEYHKQLALYDAELKSVAEQRGHAYIDLSDLLPSAQAGASPGENPLDRFTDNGMHLTPYGDWRCGPQLAIKLGAKPANWHVELRAAGAVNKEVGTKVKLGKVENGLLFEATDFVLPPPPPPAGSPKGAEGTISRTLSVVDLSPGDYELSIDGKPVAKASAAQWGSGVTLTKGPEFDQAEALRQLINEKNQQFFHRWRPQNETYLFLFRKHEQGNNAVEIPQFDPIIAEKEKKIAELAQPVKHEYRLIKK